MFFVKELSKLCDKRDVKSLETGRNRTLGIDNENEQLSTLRHATCRKANFHELDNAINLVNLDGRPNICIHLRLLQVVPVRYDPINALRGHLIEALNICTIRRGMTGIADGNRTCGI